jgi:hypothetical protein
VMDEKMKQRLDNDFKYHTPFGDQSERYVTIRDTAKTLAVTIVTLTPPSREQSVALTLLDQVVMEANAAIARNEHE